ncbi:solute carrier family 25 (mitochondrial citrate transporter), member 1 [Fistulifera solaris]|uniref:Solute carrier family 25 (Mitochondrial citrate transporter), member 1 n=1 Tax=Fistulifera solaris TaxID=1519565 RepID=A0A1Z5JG19_FISSO|nr:solute carrier family 25 (mitochondrial citrate transporter), member 1 [Fistulifera solaris]|eukprot:GAX12832.1 solute carrier family 25 (mitochondrial citrate transporter), member 1 [Fistulifera solaris]
MAPDDKKKHPLQHLLAGGAAGLVESSVCHPLDTIKTRMQLRRQSATVEKVVVKMRDSMMEPALRLQHSLQDPVLRTAGGLEPGIRLSGPTKLAHVTMHPHTVQAPLGPIGTARRIVEREGFFALYKGLTAVWTGIIPKMAIRFVSFEQYREWMGPPAKQYGVSSGMVTFTAGLASGLTEAILVVTPAEVCKIRMQSQFHSMMDPSQLQKRKYTNVMQTAFLIVKEEGLGALYKGVIPTMLRQGCNQAVNFTAYNYIKKEVMARQGTDSLDSWQSLLIGGLSGGMGPLANNPLDVVKTRLQKQVITPGKTPKYTGLGQACLKIGREEGVLALWKGITPRLLRIMPGQAITFMTYEAVSAQMTKLGWFNV